MSRLQVPKPDIFPEWKPWADQLTAYLSKTKVEPQTYLYPDSMSAVGRTVDSKLAEWVSVDDFGATGDDSESSVVTNTVAIQEAIDTVEDAGGGVVLFPSSNIYRSTKLLIGSNVSLLSFGATLKASSGLPISHPLLINRHPSSYVDENISLLGLKINGNDLDKTGTQDRFTELVSLDYITGLTIRDCDFGDFGYILLAIASSKKAKILANRFHDAGFSAATSNAGVGLWISSNGVDYPQDIIVAENDFYTLEWHAMQFSVDGGLVFGNRIRNTKEGGIFLPYVGGSSSLSRDTQVIGNSIVGVRKKDISAHGIECASRRFLIAHNYIRDCDHGGIALTDVQNGVVQGNVIANVTQLAVGWGGIDIVCASTGADKVKNLSVLGNHVLDDQTVQTIRHAVRFQGGGDAVGQDVVIGDNNFAGATFTTGVFDLGAKGASAKRYNNAGTNDNFPKVVVGEVQANAGTGAQAFTGIGFKPTQLTLSAVIATGGSKQHVCRSEIPAGGVAVCHSWSVDITVPKAFSTTAGNKAWKLYSGDGATTLAEATFTSFDADGFTVNITTATAQPWISYTAYP